MLKVTDYNKFRKFDYENEINPNQYQLGDVLLKSYRELYPDSENEQDDEIGVVITCAGRSKGHGGHVVTRRKRVGWTLLDQEGQVAIVHVTVSDQVPKRPQETNLLGILLSNEFLFAQRLGNDGPWF